VCAKTRHRVLITLGIVVAGAGSVAYPDLSQHLGYFGILVNIYWIWEG